MKHENNEFATKTVRTRTLHTFIEELINIKRVLDPELRIGLER